MLATDACSTAGKASAFQADDEGSIPFTRFGVNTEVVPSELEKRSSLLSPTCPLRSAQIGQLGTSGRLAAHCALDRGALRLRADPTRLPRRRELRRTPATRRARLSTVNQTGQAWAPASGRPAVAALSETTPATLGPEARLVKEPLGAAALP